MYWKPRKEDKYICIKDFNGFISHFVKGIVYWESDIAIRDQSNFSQYFEFYSSEVRN